MNRETYEEIKKQILDECERDLGHLEAIKGRFGVFNPKTPLKPVKNGLESPRRPDMKVLKADDLEWVNKPQIEPDYVKKLVPCEFKDCKRKANPERKCPACTKNVCSRHLRGKVCMECNQRGEE